MSEHELQVEGSSTTKLRAPLLRQLDASAYTACDLHVHSAASPDSDLAVRERIDTLLAEDVHFAVLTDHNRVTDAQAALAGAGIASLPGVEVTTWDPEFGHFNVFPRRSPPRYRGMSAVRLLHELRQESSFVQINHPRLEHHIGYFELAAFDRESGRGTDEFPLAFDALEVWNGYELSAPERRNEVFQDWLALLARGQRITATGSSDSHRAGAAPYAGYPRTYVQVPRSRAQAPGSVLAALKQGRSFVTNGPLLELRVRDHGPGETVRLARGERSLAARVDVSAPAWMDLVEVELWLGTQRVAVAALPPTKPGVRTQRATVELELSVEREHSLLATVRGRASMKPLLGRAQVKPYAFTNPVWLARL